MVDAGSLVKSAPRIDKAPFAKVLTDAGSPWAALGGSLYNLIVSKGHDPAFWLAIAGREHTFGTNPNSVLVIDGTNSWTNARTVRDPEVKKRSTIITSKKNGTEYVQYQTVGDSLLDGMYRLDDPTYRYQQEGRTTIGQVLAIWTESESVPYTQYVVDRINEWQQTGGAVVDISGYEPPRIVQQWFPVNGVSYLGDNMDMRGVCIHETGNTSPGAEAQQNVTYMNSQECISREASWQSTVGLDIIIETIPDTKQAFHGSDSGGPGNTHFFAIEGVVCYPVGSPEFQRVLMNHAWYAAKKLRDKGLPLRFNDPNMTYQVGASIAQHHNFARDSKDCPTQYRDTPGKWQQFIDYATAFYDRNEWSVPVSDVRWFAETGHNLGGAFRTYWEANGGLPIFGYPLTDEILEEGRTVQYFERSVFQFFPENLDPFRVLLRRLGAEELERKEAA